VGGPDDGNFAAIKVTGFPPTHPSEVDAALPLDFQHRLPLPPMLGAASRIRLEKIGEDIVNSITIHKFPAVGDAQEEVVAVLTNNDRTVRIYSLTQDLEVAVLDLPFAMNHATISPDGQMLVAVGDSSTAFFYERIKTKRPSSIKTPEGRAQMLPPEWQLLEQVSLHHLSDAFADGYFSTAWSPYGRLCAVGSECGYISIFDVELLRRVEYAEDALVELIPSTRPDTEASAASVRTMPGVERPTPGAIRTMHFSPSPWDLLIWSEGQGRVCVADLRAGLRVKQVLNLDPKAEGIERLEIADFDLTVSPGMHELRREADFIRSYRRALDSEGTAAAVDAATHYFEADSERSRLLDTDNDPHGLTAHERQVLETLRSTRQREEDRQLGIAPRSINYNTGRHIDSASRREQMEIMAEFVPESFRRWNRMPHERTMPRRQASVVVSIDPATINAPASLTNITDAVTTRSPVVIPAHARRETNDLVASTDDAWRTIEAALSTQAREANATASASSAIPSTTNTTTTTAPELRNELRRLRQLTQMRERLRNVRNTQPSAETYEFSLGLRRASRIAHDPDAGLKTAGLAMSEDGRTLWCGTEDGVFEFKMNLLGRKEMPAICPR
jgi:hypothetical protein